MPCWGALSRKSEQLLHSLLQPCTYDSVLQKGSAHLVTCFPGATSREAASSSLASPRKFVHLTPCFPGTTGRSLALASEEVRSHSGVLFWEPPAGIQSSFLWLCPSEGVHSPGGMLSGHYLQGSNLPSSCSVLQEPNEEIFMVCSTSLGKISTEKNLTWVFICLIFKQHSGKRENRYLLP